MADFTKTKQAFEQEMVGLCARTLALAKEIDEVAAYFTANGFQIGGPNAMTDAELLASPYPWITAASMNAAVNTLAAISIGFGVAARNTLRVIETQPINS